MTHTSEHVDELLSAWFEGDLGAAERRAVDEHLRGCLRCAKIVRDIEAIRSDAASLPPMEPSRDLWAGIAARIETPVIDLPTRQAPAGQMRRTWQMAAAAVLLMALSSGVTYVLTTGDGQGVTGEPVITAATTPDSVAVPVAPRATPKVVAPRPTSGSASTVLVGDPGAAEIVYDQEITRLRKILDERRSDLDPATVAAVERSLRAIDAAITDARTALASDGSSLFLNEQLNRALEKKLGVLRRVALMPAGAS
jgi:hypothetical protein